MEKILIVDSSEMNRAMLSELFGRNFEVLEAVSGVQGTEILQKETVTLVFLSPYLLSHDSERVLEQMKADGVLEKIPLVLIAEDANAPEINRLLNEGAAEVIQSPFYPSIIRKRISRLLESRRSETVIEAEKANWRRILAQQAESRKQSDYMVFELLGDVLEFGTGDAGGHTRRIRLMTGLLMKKASERGMGSSLTAREIQEISMAAVMHDIGKIMIPREILEKPGKLTEEELSLVKRHAVYGEQLLRETGFLDAVDGRQFYYDICRWHHERYDGSGYPDGLTGEQIPLWAQIVGLADCYDTLVNKRVYKPAYDHKQAIQMLLSGERGSFSPALLDILKESQNELYRIVQDNGILMDQEADIGVSFWRKESIEESKVLSERVQRLFESEQMRYRQVSGLSQDITFEWQRANNQLRFSPEFSAVFGIETVFPENIREVRLRPLIVKEDIERLKDAISELSAEKTDIRVQIRLIQPGRMIRWYELFIHTVWSKNTRGSVVPSFCSGCVGKLSCIDERKQKLLQWEDKATRDFLTGLLLRKKMEEMLDEMVEGNEPFALMYMDIDHFKRINDQRGHLFGDKFLKTFAQILRENLRASDLIARVGGDEFIAVLRRTTDRMAVMRKAAVLTELFQRIPDVDGSPGHFSGSIGISFFPGDGKTAEEILHRADQALYNCKHNEAQRYDYYRREMGE